MLAPQKSDVFRVFELEGHEEADGFKRVEAFVDIVAQEHILVALHLVLIRKAEVLKKSHQVEETPINTAEDLDWRAHSDQTGLFQH